jgi:hypothetical protein
MGCSSIWTEALKYPGPRSGYLVCWASSKSKVATMHLVALTPPEGATQSHE